MRKIAVVLLLLGGVVATNLLSCDPGKSPGGGAALYHWFGKESDELLAHLQKLAKSAERNEPLVILKDQFRQSRLQYKYLEPVIEYYFQGLTRRINGPALPDVKTEDNQVFPPHGFQVIEQLLWSGEWNRHTGKELVQEIRLLETDLRFVQSSLKDQAILSRHVREMIQHQLIRIGVLGITGFDAPLSKLSLEESTAALEGLQLLIDAYSKGEGNKVALDVGHQRLFDEAKQFLQAHTDFDTFDRLRYLRDHLAPLSASLLAVPSPATTEDSAFAKLFTGSLQDMLKGQGFNPDFYAGYAASGRTPAKVELGRALFSENRLSRNSTISCATCHRPDRYFTDSLQKAANFVHGGKLARNTPSLYYSGLQASQFYDMRSTTIEDQVNEVMENSEEFDLASSEIAARLQASPVYRTLSKTAFGRDSLSGFEVRNALAAYIRSLNPFSSRFDAFLQGKNDAMSKEEQHGFNLFAGKAKCATCHFVPLFNGTVPPWFTKSESEIIGVPQKAVWAKASIDSDVGRFRQNALPELQFAFKTPTVRNSARTAPYMHNGVYNTLDEVVEFYHRGGGVGLGMDLPFQSLPFDSLQLSVAEKSALVSFLKSLDDKQ